MILLIYLFLSLYFGRKNPFFFLILPFALQQGQGSFINQSFVIGGKQIFSVLDKIFVDVLFIITTLIAFIFMKARLPKNVFLTRVLVSIYFFYVLFILLLSFKNNFDSTDVILTGRTFFYISLSYFLWLAIFHVVTRAQYEEFLRVMFYVTPVSALLYILNSSNTLSIFNKQIMYSEIQGDGGSFYRDFSTIPIYLIPILVLSIMSFFTDIVKVPKWIKFVNIVLLPITVVFTFTRSTTISAVISILVVLFLVAYNNRSKVTKPLFRLAMIVFIVIIPSFFITEKIFPSAVHYFNQRFETVAVEKGKEENVNVRLEYLNKAIDLTAQSNLTGIGFDRKYYNEMNAVGAWIADSTIPYLLYHTGWLGVLLIYILLISVILDSIMLYSKTRDWLVAFLCSSFISLLISSLLMGGQVLIGTVWTFMNIALYSTIKYNLWKKDRKPAL